MSALIESQFREVAGPTGARRVLVARPRTQALLDRARLERMREHDYESPINEELLQVVARSAEPVSAIVFDASSANWGFSDDLADDELVELGYHMVRSQLGLYRSAATAGVQVVVGVGFGTREVDGYTRGGERLVEELERALQNRTDADSSESRLDLWLVDHLTLWTTTGLDEFLADKFSEAISAAERGRRKLDRLLAALPT